MQSLSLTHTRTHMRARLVTSPGLLEMVTPFSLGMLLELLLGELGPEPGALLHADSAEHHTLFVCLFVVATLCLSVFVVFFFLFPPPMRCDLGWFSFQGMKYGRRSASLFRRGASAVILFLIWFN